MDGALVRLVILARDPDATRWLGHVLGSAAREAGGSGSLLIELSGPIGVGKTTLAQGIGAGLGIAERITSPTFALIHEHLPAAGGPEFVHADLYRIEAAGEVQELALDESLEAGAVVAVEWPERAGTSLAAAADGRITIEIEALGVGAEPGADPSSDAGSAPAPHRLSQGAPRRIRITALGRMAQAVVDRLGSAIDADGSGAGVRRAGPPA